MKSGILYDEKPRISLDFNEIVEELFISGCSINNFAFISDFPNLKKLIILDCRSEAYAKGNIHIVSGCFK